MKTQSVAAAACLIAVALSAAACKNDATSTGAAQPAASHQDGTSDPGDNPAQPAKGTADPCALLSDAQIAAALGGSGTKLRDGDSGISRVCQYDGNDVSLEVEVFDDPVTQAKFDKSAGLSQMKKINFSAPAFQDTSNGRLHVLKAPTEIAIMISDPTSKMSDAQRLAAEETLATAVLGKL